MASHNNSKGINALSKKTWNITAKTDYSSHSLIQEVVNTTGMSSNIAVEMLVQLGLDRYFKIHKGEYDSPKIRLLFTTKVVQEKERIRETLSSLKHKIPEDEFVTLCEENGEDPKDYADIPEPDKAVTKQDRCEEFLEILLTDRPKGLPGTRVVEIAEEYDFGKNLTQRSANQIGITKKRRKFQGKQTSMWIPQHN